MSSDLFEAVLTAWNAIATESDFGRLIEGVVQVSRSLTGGEHASLALAEGRWLRFSYSTLLPLEEIKKYRIKFGEGIPGQVAISQDPLRVAYKTDSDPASSAEQEFVTKSVLCVPMVIQQQTFGIIQVFNKIGEEGFAIADESRLQLFANQAALGIEHFILQDRILQESRRVQSIFEALTDGIMVVDPEGNPVLYNKAVELLFFPDGRQNYALTTYLSNLVKGKDSTGSAEVFLLKPHNLILSNRYVVVRDGAGNPLEIVVSIRNITDQSSLDRRFSQFYAIMLRYSRKIVKKSLSLKTKKARRKLLKKQENILQNLVFLTELKSGPLRIEKENHDILKLYSSVRDRLKTRFQKAGVKLFDASIQELGSQIVRMEILRFTHVFHILLKKGLQFLPKNSGEMRVHAKIDSGKILFEAEYLGKDIEQKINEEVFEWNRQIDRIIAGEGKSLDLDLAFMRHMIRAHKGNVQVLSNEPHKAVIRFDVFID